MLGAGFISDYHLAGLRAAGAELVAISSRNEENASVKARQYGIPHVATSASAVISRPDIDAVVIATPDFTHEAIAIEAARAGKAILLQKPMARTSAEARRIIDTANGEGVPLLVSFMHRYFAEVLHLRALLAEGTLGPVSWVRQRNATPGADWASWFYDRRLSGGVVMQLGVHGIDLLRHLFGEIALVKGETQLVRPIRTLADGTTVTTESEDVAVAVYRFASGLTAVHEMSYCEAAGTDRFRMEVYGDNATAWLRSEHGRLAVSARTASGELAWQAPRLMEDNSGTRHHQHVIAMIRGETPLDTSAHDGLASLLVAEAIHRSTAAGGWTEVWA
jgi:myo-inositol 2-dehydrogenase/D-chiro-inositol 1-dehydrogenase